MAASAVTLVIFWEKSVTRISITISVVTLFRIIILGDPVITFGSFTPWEYYLITSYILLLIQSHGEQSFTSHQWENQIPTESQEWQRTQSSNFHLVPAAADCTGLGSGVKLPNVDGRMWVRRRPDLREVAWLLIIYYYTLTSHWLGWGTKLSFYP